jgi:hypothetical protein
VGVPRVAWFVLLAIAGVLAFGLLAAAFVVAAGSDGDAEETEATLPATRRLELPLADDDSALMLAKRSGRALVGIAFRPGAPVEVAVLRGEQAIPASELSFAVNGREVEPQPCGYGCFALAAPEPRRIAVGVPALVRFDLPATLPRSGTQIFARVTRTMERLRTYRFNELLTAGVGRGTSATFAVQAPNRMRFRTAAGSRSVVVGRSRWDRRAGRWQRTPFPGVELPSFMWDGAGHARVLPGPGGNSTSLAVFDREPVPAWFKLTIDDENHVVDAEMLAPSHFMRQRFYDFNAPLRIVPPA